MSSSKRTAEILAARAFREQRRRERFGDEDACETCGLTTLEALNRVDAHVVCACCLALARGREVLEVHHLAGRHDGPTVRVCANCHAELSERQRDWLWMTSHDSRLARGRADAEALRADKEDTNDSAS